MCHLRVPCVTRKQKHVFSTCKMKTNLDQLLIMKDDMLISAATVWSRCYLPLHPRNQLHMLYEG